MAASEEWRPVKGYEGHYEVSSFGRVRSVKKSQAIRVRAISIRPDGYEIVSLFLNNEKKTHLVHRLVAVAFLIDGSRETVNHKDGAKRNNHAENLEWNSYEENNRHAVFTGLRVENAEYLSRRRPVIGVGPEGQGLYIKSITSASLFGFSFRKVFNVASGRSRTHKGWTWSYA